ncbi:hypothetical protein BIV23_25855 [Streptomyces monashensis]|uniref:Uncharacterized protein n=1 Tax=Streptomyces monashensis TaxID=1678012 RepID=A0A1S2Q668_9ACTN|nr:hypothetical protein BIV23_25855 [Streptomyces monashensis]
MTNGRHRWYGRLGLEPVPAKVEGVHSKAKRPHRRNRHWTRPLRGIRLRRSQGLGQLHTGNGPPLQHRLCFRQFAQNPVRLRARLIDPHPRRHQAASRRHVVVSAARNVRR